jgi:beta-galactosidase
MVAVNTIMKITSEGRQNLDRQWCFSFGDSHGVPFVPKSQGVAVDLPHDYSIIQERDPKAPGGNSVGYFPGGVATYEKTLIISGSLAGKQCLLEFEGVYMNSVVLFNDNIVARQHYGYTTFYCDVTRYVHYGQENKISVIVNNSAQPNSRWYSGSGIYRHVSFLVYNSIHIPPSGIFATTPIASAETGMVSVKTAVENHGSDNSRVTVRSTLMDASGKAVAKKSSIIKVPAGGRTEASQKLQIASPRLWSVDDPYLYTLKSEILNDNEIFDSRITHIGIRSIVFNPKEGFLLNGVSLKMKGGCVHSDNGILGAASYDRAEERKVELLKKNGFNAVRCVHNPPSRSFLDACDRLGLLVIDEAFDCWREGKCDNDYSLYFEEWWQRDLSAMILRDRNHPSIIMWSIGNEIREITGNSDGYALARRLADFMRLLDDTRPVTVALQEFYLIKEFTGDLFVPDEIWNEHSSGLTEAMDIVCVNYGRSHFDGDGRNFPNRVIVSSESYPQQAYDYWEEVQRLSHVTGDFVWTALDYLGESGIGRVDYESPHGFLGEYPWHQANAGDLDLCGFKRPQSYYRDCVWGNARSPYIAVFKPEHYGKTPVISPWGWPDVVSSWTWPGYEGKAVRVDIYNTDSEIELFLNGKSMGRKPAGKANRYMASFETVYEPGELMAVGYRDGVEISRSLLKTSGQPAFIRLTPDREIINAAYGDLSYVAVEMLDAEGNLARNADNNIRFTVHGPGTLLAVGSGNPKTEEMYTGNQRRLFNGLAMAVVRSDGTEGEIAITAESDGIPVSRCIIIAR